MLEEYMREACTKVSSVDIKLFLAWKVYVNTARAENFDS